MASRSGVDLPVLAYNHLVPTFMCRWPNGDLSFVSARNKEDAIIMLDEWGNAELAELRQTQDFMVDFRLTDDGDLDFHAFGERVLDDIWERAYPVIAQARLTRSTAPTDGAGELTKERACGGRSEGVELCLSRPCTPVQAGQAITDWMRSIKEDRR